MSSMRNARVDVRWSHGPSLSRAKKLPALVLVTPQYQRFRLFVLTEKK